MPLPKGHLFWDYRLAKFETASERRSLSRHNFANFEKDLGANLARLAQETSRLGDAFFATKIGKVWIRPKGVSRPIRSTLQNSVVTVPDRPDDHQISGISIRVVLEPSPEFALLEVRWLRAFGPTLDSLLSKSRRGNRLNLQGHPPELPYDGRSIFKYWVPAYREFRRDALDAAKQVLISNRAGKCILTALDFASYYDNIAPDFLVEEGFVRTLASGSLLRGIRFEAAEYLSATEGLLASFARYRDAASELTGIRSNLGIPIGALTSRLIANLALAELDQHILRQRTVRHYSRYVDDILVVESVPATTVDSTHDLISRLLPIIRTNGKEAIFTLDSAAVGRPSSHFSIQNDKLRVFDLAGEHGLEYLKSVESEIEKVSSERRRFLEPWRADLDQTVVASPRAEPIRALREADALSLRKMAVRSVAQKVTTSAAMLDRSESSRFSRENLGKAARLATEWSRWVELIDVSLDILSAALVSCDVATANEITGTLLSRLDSLSGSTRTFLKIDWNGKRLSKTRARKHLRLWIEAQIADAIASSAPFTEAGFVCPDLDFFVGARTDGRAAARSANLLASARLLSATDLRASSRESDLAIGTELVRRPNTALSFLYEQISFDPGESARLGGLREFLRLCTDLRDRAFEGLGPLDVLLMPQPPTFTDILLKWLTAVRPPAELIHVVNAVRGTRYTVLPFTYDENSSVIHVENDRSPDPSDRTRLILGNLCTDDDWWAASLAKPKHTIERQRRLARVVNQAMEAARREPTRPSVLVLPELSLPRRWVREVLHYFSLQTPRVALIAGLEYDVVGKSVYNEAIGYFPRSYRSAAGWIWTKQRPAHREQKLLNGLTFDFAARGSSHRFAVAWSEHGRMIPLICSEMLEVDTRAKILGRADLVMIPAWNTDTTSFEYFIHAAALELHAFVAVSNNGIYSDTRARGPYSEAWMRDVCRLISRGHNEVIVSDLPIGALREYQTSEANYIDRRKNWLAANPKSGSETCPWPEWKPVPPGLR